MVGVVVTVLPCAWAGALDPQAKQILLHILLEESWSLAYLTTQSQWSMPSEPRQGKVGVRSGLASCVQALSGLRKTWREILSVPSSTLKASQLWDLNGMATAVALSSTLGQLSAGH